MQPDAIEIPEKLYRRLQNALDDLDEAADRISAYVEKKRLL
jgi:DNA replication initiation complex subunit (GINS family)